MRGHWPDGGFRAVAVVETRLRQPAALQIRTAGRTSAIIANVHDDDDIGIDAIVDRVREAGHAEHPNTKTGTGRSKIGMAREVIDAADDRLLDAKRSLRVVRLDVVGERSDIAERTRRISDRS